MEAVLGLARRAESAPEDPWARVYRAYGATWLGYDTLDSVHLCSDECLRAYTAQWVQVTQYTYIGLPDNGAIPTLELFDDQESDAPALCEVCRDAVPVPLTDVGRDYVAEAVEEALVKPEYGIETAVKWAAAHPEARANLIGTGYARDATDAELQCAVETARDNPEGATIDDDQVDDDLVDFIWSNIRELAGLPAEFVGRNFWLARNQQGGFPGLMALERAARSYGPRDLVRIEDRLYFD